jgi:hypothetical protein
MIILLLDATFSSRIKGGRLMADNYFLNELGINVFTKKTTD